MREGGRMSKEGRRCRDVRRDVKRVRRERGARGKERWGEREEM